MHKPLLLVEDDTEIRETLAEILRLEGFTVITAQNGSEALGRMGDGLPCLMLLDLMMPVMDGWTLRAEMLKHPEFAEIPVVVLSGGADLPEHASALGAVAYLQKPFKVERVLETVKIHC
jgi:CheY-like chemotaxis protein